MPEITYNFTKAGMADEMLAALANRHAGFQDSIRSIFAFVDPEVAQNPGVRHLYTALQIMLQNHMNTNANLRRVLADAQLLYRLCEEKNREKSEMLDKSFVFFNMETPRGSLPGFMERDSFLPFRVTDPALPGGYRPDSTNLNAFAKIMENAMPLVVPVVRTTKADDFLASIFQAWLGLPDLRQSAVVDQYRGHGKIALSENLKPVWDMGPGGLETETVQTQTTDAPILNMAYSLQHGLLPAVLCASLVTVAIPLLAAITKKSLVLWNGSVVMGQGNRSQDQRGNTKTSALADKAGIGSDPAVTAREVSELSAFRLVQDTTTQLFASGKAGDLLYVLLPFALILGATAPIAVTCCDAKGLEQLKLSVGGDGESVSGAYKEAERMKIFQTIKDTTSDMPGSGKSEMLHTLLPFAFILGAMAPIAVTRCDEKGLGQLKLSIGGDGEAVSGAYKEAERMKMFQTIKDTTSDMSGSGKSEMLHTLLPFALILGAAAPIAATRCDEKGLGQLKLSARGDGESVSGAYKEANRMNRFQVIKGTDPVITVMPAYLLSIEPWMLIENTNTAPWAFSTETIKNVKDLLALYGSREKSAPFTHLSAFRLLSGGAGHIPDAKLFAVYQMAPLVLVGDRAGGGIDEPARVAYAKRMQGWLLSHQDDFVEVIYARLAPSHDLQTPELRKQIKDVLAAQVFSDGDFMHIEAFLRKLFDTAIRLLARHHVSRELKNNAVMQDSVQVLMQPHFSETYSLSDVVRVPGRAFGSVQPVITTEPLTVYSAYKQDVYLSPLVTSAAMESVTAFVSDNQDDEVGLGVREKLTEAGISAVIANKEELGGVATIRSGEAGKASKENEPAFQLANFLLYKSDAKMNSPVIQLNGMSIRRGGNSKEAEELRGLKSNKQQVNGIETEDVDNRVIAKAQSSLTNFEPSIQNPTHETMIAAFCNAVVILGIRGLLTKTKKEIDQLGLHFEEDSLQALLLSALSDTMEMAGSVVSEMMPLTVFVQFALASDQFVSQFAFLAAPLVAEIGSDLMSDVITRDQSRRQS